MKNLFIRSSRRKSAHASNRSELTFAATMLIAFTVTVLHAQTVSTAQTSDLSTMLETVEQMPTVSADSVPPFGNYYSMQHAPGTRFAWPPLPRNSRNVPVWDLGGNMFLMDDEGVDYSAPITSSFSKSSSGMMSASMMSMDTPDSGDGLTYPHWMPPTNYALWIEISNRVDNGTAYLNLHNASNYVYEISSRTNLLNDWSIEAEVFPNDTNCMPFTVPTLNRQNLFLKAEDWTDVWSNGLPEWWTWLYFGNLDETASDLDMNGNTLGYDYTNSITPAIFTFSSVEVANNYASSSSAAAQLDVSGSPYYIAISVDDTNYASDASWQTYTGTNITVDPGLAEGWHDVWIGLRGHGDDPSAAVWQWKRLKLDLTPPQIVVTNPTISTVDVPMIQLQGFSPEALASISYDLSNAVVVITNQQVLILDRHYDTTTWEFTTNTFQAFDVDLTNGLNIITLHATDLAGNTTTTDFSFTLDYSSKTNAPNVQITWPQDEMQLCGGSFTLRGQVDDATVRVSASMVNTNGNTNVVGGVVERDGRFWLENLPLNSGTNNVSITVSDVVGNTTLTNITLIRSDTILTMDPVSGDSLWQPTLNTSGHVSDPTAAIYVNGIQGTNNGDGTWSANNVPTTPGGVAVFDMKAIPAGGGDPDASTNMDKPWRVFVFSDTQDLTATTDYKDEVYESDSGGIYDGDESSYEDQTWIHYNHDWTYGIGGSGSEYNNWQESYQEDYLWIDAGGMDGSMAWDGTGYGKEIGANNDGTTTTDFTNALWIFDKIGNEHCNVNDPVNTNWDNDYSAWDDDNERGSQHDTYTRTADTVWHVQTGGKAVPGLLNLWQFSGSASEILDKRAVPQSYGSSKTIPYDQIAIGGMGNLLTNGIRYNLLPNGAQMDVTPKVAGKDFYTFNVGGQKYLSYFDVYVIKGNPTPFSFDEGHAWWGLRTDVPSEALPQLLSNTERLYLSKQQFGYYPTDTSFPGYLYCPGQLAFPETHQSSEADVRRHFFIGFNGLKNALDYTIGLSNSPGYYVAPANNCVNQVRADANAAGGTAGVTTFWPYIFGTELQIMYWHEDKTYSSLILP